MNVDQVEELVYSDMKEHIEAFEIARKDKNISPPSYIRERAVLYHILILRTN